MTNRTQIHEALERVDDERDHVTSELAAFDRFDDGVRDVEPVVRTDRWATSPSGGGGTVLTASTTRELAGSDATARVRELFAETVRPYSTADIDEPESLVATMAEELGESVAAALSPSTAGQFTPEVNAAIHSAVDRRRAELRLMDRALETETASLTAALEQLEPVLEGVTTVCESSVLEFGFEALREHHDRLETHRDRCGSVSRERQDLFSRTTGHGVTAGLSHRSLVQYLYRESSTTYPVLSTAVRLDRSCTERQRLVRDHLTRRV